MRKEFSYCVNFKSEHQMEEGSQISLGLNEQCFKIGKSYGMKRLIYINIKLLFGFQFTCYCNIVSVDTKEVSLFCNKDLTERFSAQVSPNDQIFAINIDISNA